MDQGNWGASIFAKAYTNNWTATNQIQQTAVDNGTLNLYGTMDPSDGGDTDRVSLSSNMWNKGDNCKMTPTSMFFTQTSIFTQTPISIPTLPAT